MVPYGIFLNIHLFSRFDYRQRGEEKPETCFPAAAGVLHAHRAGRPPAPAHTLRLFAAQPCPLYAFSSSIGLSRMPMPSISISQTSPRRIQAGGLRAWATPDGVPVSRRSPGSSVMPLVA
jgi:hypothetical protein